MIWRIVWERGYTLILWLALPLVLARLYLRGRREPGYRHHIAERFGRYRSRPRKPIIWVHAVSVGETRAAQPLVKLLGERHPECEILITQMTASGRDTAERLYGGEATLAYLPYDYPFAVKRFLAHFRPRLGVLMETEVWFNLVRGCARFGVPLVLANARLSEKSARGYETVAPLARAAFGRLSAVAAQTNADAQRLTRLGARAAEVTGNIKFDVAQPPQALALVARLRQCYGTRQVFLAASTREGEEALLLDALAKQPLGAALLLIVPRHPQRFAEVARLLEQRGIAFVRRSDEARVPAACGVMLGDSLGEMAAYYASCDVALIGGSLLPYGAQNLIEACAAGVPALIGPSTYNFAHAASEAVQSGAACAVANASEAVTEAKRLLADKAARKAMSAAGLAFCEAHRGASVRVAAICDRLLAR